MKNKFHYFLLLFSLSIVHSMLYANGNNKKSSAGTGAQSCPLTMQVIYDSPKHCTGELVSLRAMPNNVNATYSWTCPGGNCPIGFNANIYNPSFLAPANLSGNGMYYVTYNDNNGCISVDSILVESNPRAYAVVSYQFLGNCPGDSVMFCAVDTTAGSVITSYQWYGMTDTAACITRLRNEFINQQLPQVFITNSFGCTSNNFIMFSIPPTGPEPDTTVTITGNTQFCPGDSVILCANGANVTSTVWDNGDSAFCTTINTSGVYTATVSAWGGCSKQTSPVTVTVFPQLLAQLSLSPNNDTIYSNLSGSNYMWYYSADGQSYSSISANDNFYLNPASGYYYLQFYDQNGCVILSDTIYVTCHIQAYGSTFYNCSGDLYNLSVSPYNPGSTYLWTCPGGVCPNMFDPSSSISSFIVPSDLSCNGMYYVTVTDSNGCVATDSVFVNCHYRPFALVSFQFLGNCPGDSVTFCVHDTLPGSVITSYLWDGWNNDTTECITVLRKVFFTQHIPQVQITNSDGCTSNNSIMLFVSPTGPEPDTTVTITGNTQFCPGDSVILCANGANATSTVWDNGDSAFCTTISTSGVYSATVSGWGGCSKQTSPVTVTVFPQLQAHLSLSPNNDTIYSNLSGSNYMWYYSVDGQSYSSTPANSNYIPVTTFGYYYLQFTDTNGCTAFSDTLAVTGIRELDAGLLIYPNPVTDVLTIIFPPELADSFIEMYEVSGKRILIQRLTSEGKLQMNVSSFASGIYYLHITTDNGVVTRKIAIRR
ncbi:MAG: T9SS type A sorting domain-containing protein [Bacteroidetes bacterium]|nr:T9SS type A sorting domain-containing protein [Bacteroidota bacterium]